MLFILGTSSYQCDVWDAEESSGPGGLLPGVIQPQGGGGSLYTRGG